MKHYETVRMTPLIIDLEANFVVSMPLDGASVSVEEFETVQKHEGDEVYDYFGLDIIEY